MVANQRVQKEMHVVVHVGELERVRERVDATRDKPHRQATATRSAHQPDPGAVLSSSASSAVCILSSGAKSFLVIRHPQLREESHIIKENRPCPARVGWEVPRDS